MEQIKKTAKKVFFLPYWLTILISVPGYLFVAYVLTNGLERTMQGAAAYALSSYSLIISGTAVYRIVIFLKERITSHRFWKRYRTDLVFRTKISLLPNTVITLVFVLLKLTAGLYYQSIWMIALAIYYASLLLFRISLLRRVYRHSITVEQEDESRITRRYGGYLLLLDIALGGIVLYSLYRGAEYSYPGYLIYAMAAYTFYAVIMAAVGLFKKRRREGAIVTTLNILKLTTALVSLFALETAMLTTFGEESSQVFRQYMVAATGFMIVAVIFGMALCLIIRFQRRKNRK